MNVSSREKALARLQNPKHVRKDKRRAKGHPAPGNRPLTQKEQARAEEDAEMIARTGTAGYAASRKSKAPRRSDAKTYTSGI